MKIAIATCVVVAALVSPALAEVATPPPAPASVYKLDVTIAGLDAKPSTFSLVLEENQPGSIEIGNNIPLVAGGGNIQRQDVGLKIHLRYALHGATVLADGEVEMSSVDPPTASGSAVFHRVRTSGMAAITPGSPALLATATDVVAHRRYEITVAAQKVM